MYEKILFAFLVIALSIISTYGSMEFDGVDDRIEAPDSDSLDLPGIFTIQAWFNTNDKTKSQYMVSKTDFGQNKRSYHFSWYGAGVSWNLAVSPNGYADIGDVCYYQFPYGITNGDWYHVVCIYDRTQVAGQRLKCYVNGGPVSPTVIGDNQPIPYNNDLPLKIGASRSAGVYSSCVDGTLTECAVWETALSGSDIEQLANSRVKHMPLQIRPDKLVAYWPLDDVASGETGNGKSFRDLSSYRNNGDGSWGANASGLIGKGEEVLSYP